MSRTFLSAPIASPPSSQTQQDPLHRLGYVLARAAIILLFSRLIEFVPGFVAVIRPGVLLVLSCLAIAFLTGGINRVFSSGITISLLAFTFWSAAGLPFSVWRSGALRIWLSYWVMSILIHVALVALLDTVEACRRAMYSIAVSMFMLSALSLFMGQTSRGRYGLSSGALGNANLLAMVLLIGAPFCLLAATHFRGLRRLGAGATLLMIVITVFRTGSRAGLLTIAVLTCLIFLRISMAGKFKLAVACAVTFAVALGATSQSARGRFRTLLKSGDDQLQSLDELSAVESTLTRKALLRESFVQTWKHPLFGVGTGMFMVAEANDAEQENRMGMWHVSHNAYTQISSETGIPAFLCYAAAMILCFRKIWDIRKITRGRPEFAFADDMAFSLRLSLIAYAITSFFASSAYECYFPILAALTAVFEMAAKKEIEAFRGASGRPPGRRPLAPPPSSL